MKRNMSPRSWTLHQGLAAQYAAQAGIDSDIAADAGEDAWDLLKSLRDATDETDPRLRHERMRSLQRSLAKGALGQYSELRQSVQSRLQELENIQGSSINPETGLQEFNSDLERESECSEMRRLKADAKRRLENLKSQLRQLASSLMNPNVSEGQRRDVQNRISELNTEVSILESDIDYLDRRLEQLRCEFRV